MSAQRVLVSRQAARRIAVRVPIAICLSVLLSLAFSYGSLIVTGDAGMKQTDFIAYYSGASLVISGHGSHLYDFSALAAVENHLVHPLVLKSGVLPYVYPPYLALTQAPLATLPYSVAWLLWLGVNIAVLFAVLAALRRKIGLHGDAAVLWWAAAISSLPVFIALAQGQTSIVILGLLALCVLRSADHDDWIAGIALGLACIKPPYLIPILMVLVVGKRWRALAAAIGVGLALFLLPLLFLGPHIDSAYISTLVKATGWQEQFGYGPLLNDSLAGSARLLLAGSASTVVTAAADIAILALVLAAALRSRTLELPLGMAVLAAILIAPHVLVHDLVLLVIPIALALRRGITAPLLTILGCGYVGIVAGLRLVGLIHIQLSVVFMLALAAWYLAATLSRAEPSERGAVERVSAASSDIATAGANRSASW